VPDPQGRSLGFTVAVEIYLSPPQPFTLLPTARRVCTVLFRDEGGIRFGASICLRRAEQFSGVWQGNDFFSTYPKTYLFDL
jgi:hypothetical protein